LEVAITDPARGTPAGTIRSGEGKGGAITAATPGYSRIRIIQEVSDVTVKTAIQGMVGAIADIVSREKLDDVLDHVGVMPDQDVIDSLIESGELGRSIIGLAAKHELQRAKAGNITLGVERATKLSQLVEMVVAAERTAGTANIEKV